MNICDEVFEYLPISAGDDNKIRFGIVRTPEQKLELVRNIREKVSARLPDPTRAPSSFVLPQRDQYEILGSGTGNTPLVAAKLVVSGPKICTKADPDSPPVTRSRSTSFDDEGYDSRASSISGGGDSANHDDTAYPSLLSKDAENGYIRGLGLFSLDHDVGVCFEDPFLPVPVCSSGEKDTIDMNDDRPGSDTVAVLGAQDNMIPYLQFTADGLRCNLASSGSLNPSLWCACDKVRERHACMVQQSTSSGDPPLYVYQEKATLLSGIQVSLSRWSCGALRISFDWGNSVSRESTSLKKPIPALYRKGQFGIDSERQTLRRYLRGRDDTKGYSVAASIGTRIEV